jgi:hypothetical protein
MAHAPVNHELAAMVKPGFRFKDDNDVSFTIIDEVPDKENFFYVQVSSVGGGFFSRGKPTVANRKYPEMSLTRILELAERSLGDKAVANMNTIGTRNGDRTEKRAQKGRPDIRFAAARYRLLSQPGAVARMSA